MKIHLSALKIETGWINRGVISKQICYKSVIVQFPLVTKIKQQITICKIIAIFKQDNIIIKLGIILC